MIFHVYQNVHFSTLEEEVKRFHNNRNNQSEYNNTGFQYEDASKPVYDGDEEYDPNECIQDDVDQGTFQNIPKISFSTILHDIQWNLY